jgi:aspartate carbamoyltransferase catalytic subunit
MKHLLDIATLSTETALQLIERAQFFKTQTVWPTYASSEVALLFYENSTRTTVSFELAAKRLNMRVVLFNIAHSSEAKGENIEDTIRTLAAMGIHLIVIRHPESGMPKHLATVCPPQCQIINAGDGQNEHPTQALLDMMTILEHHPDLSRLKITIVGDLRHSRVANSLQHLCRLFKVGELALVSPHTWQPETIFYGTHTTSLEKGLRDADVVIALRIQKERLHAEEALDLHTYRSQYAITTEMLRFAKKGAAIMHPGPVNRDLEIDSILVDSAPSRILQQVENGVFLRMAVLEHGYTHSK